MPLASGILLHPNAKGERSQIAEIGTGLTSEMNVSFVICPIREPTRIGVTVPIRELQVPPIWMYYRNRIPILC